MTCADCTLLIVLATLQAVCSMVNYNTKYSQLEKELILQYFSKHFLLTSNKKRRTLTHNSSTYKAIMKRTASTIYASNKIVQPNISNSQQHEAKTKTKHNTSSQVFITQRLSVGASDC